MRGLMHIHSTYSDGKLNLQNLKDLCKNRDFEFLLLTEHIENMNPSKMEEFVAECDNLSDKSFLLIPGLEFTCEGDLHILGVGVRYLLDEKPPRALIKSIHQQGGLAILAHPSRNGFQLDVNNLITLDGVEVWNRNYDGKFFPK